ncbi:Transposable element Tc3 transposase [Camponotus japonicus]
MTPLDFFLWGYLKEQVYKTKPTNIEELKQRITDEMSLITVDMLRNVRDSFQLRLVYCQAVEGRQFEHLL